MAVYSEHAKVRSIQTVAVIGFVGFTIALKRKKIKKYFYFFPPKQSP